MYIRFLKFRRKKSKTKDRSGRSMVEMLGVLVVVGILSIGGIAGYRYAMTKYRANETLNALRLISHNIRHQAAQGFAPTLEDGYQRLFSGDIRLLSVGEENETQLLYVALSGVPEGVCDLIRKQEGLVADHISIKKLNPTDENTLCGDVNEMTFYYVEEKSGADQTCSVSCGVCQTCVLGACVNKNDGELCETGTCQSGYCSHSEKPKKNCESDDDCGTCQICANTAAFGASCVASSEVVCTQKECSSNESCAHDEFCSDKNNDYNNATPYKCVGLNFYRIVNEHNQVFMLSRNRMSWWDADASCRAMGMQLMEGNEIAKHFEACTADADSAVVTQDEAGNPVYDGLTELAQGLYDKLDNPESYIQVWVSTPCPSMPGVAHRLGLYKTANVQRRVRTNIEAHALCK